MLFFKILAWLILLYGVIGIILRMVKIEHEVPDGAPDNWGKQKMKTVYSPIKLPATYDAAILGLLSAFMLSIIVVVGAQEVGVITTPQGVKESPLHTGWHVVAFWNKVHFMDKTVWVYTCANAVKEGAKPNADAIWAPTKDGIKMGFDVSVSWRIIGDEAPWIYQNVTENDGGNSGRYIWLEENVIRPKLKSAMALTVSNFTPIEAYSTKRQEIQNEVLKRIGDECKQYKLQIDNVDVREVYYNTDFETSINAKKLAEQEALRLAEVTKQQEELKKQEAIKKDIAILAAEGVSKALQIKGQSITANPKIIQLEWIEAWKAGGSQVPKVVSGNSGSMYMMNLDLNNK
jgi:regulator of protease activity HflC (stomatin/prohibitin superfamily)